MFAIKYHPPGNFDAVILNDSLAGPKGYISADIIKKYVAPPTLSEKVKVFVCGQFLNHAFVSSISDYGLQALLDKLQLLPERKLVTNRVN